MSATTSDPATPTTAAARSAKGMARYAIVVCVLAVAAAVMSFVKGSWIGVVWVLLAGLTSNMAWYYVRRARAARSAAAASDAPAAGPAASGKAE